MKVFDLLDEIMNEIEEGRKSLFAARKTIDVDFVLEILQAVRDALPQDMQRAQKIIAEKDRILREARELASDIVEEAQQSAEDTISDHRVLQIAYDKGDRIMEEAERHAYQLRMDADDYALSVLDDLTSYVSEYVKIIGENRSNFMNRVKREAESLRPGTGSPRPRGGHVQ